MKSNKSIVERLSILERELGIISESLTSIPDIEKYLRDKSLPEKVDSIDIDDRLTGDDIVEMLNSDDPRFIGHTIFNDIKDVLGTFSYSGFCCDFTPKLKIREFRNKKYYYPPYERGLFYLTKVNGKPFNGIKQFLKDNFDDINAKNSLQKFVNGEITLINRDVIIRGDVNFSGQLKNFKTINEYLKSLKIKCILEVTGDFDVSFNNLESLWGMPKKIGGDLNISNNNIEDFKYHTEDLKNVKGELIWDGNPIESWEDLPINLADSVELKLASTFKCRKVELDGNIINVTGDVNLKEKLGSYKSVHEYLYSKFGLDRFGIIEGRLNISYNNLDTLYGCPETCWGVNASNNKLRNLEHCPKVGGGSLLFESNLLISLKGIKDKKLDLLSVQDNNLKTLDFIPEEVRVLFVSENPGLDGNGFSPDYIKDMTNVKYIEKG